MRRVGILVGIALLAVSAAEAAVGTNLLAPLNPDFDANVIEWDVTTGTGPSPAAEDADLCTPLSGSMQATASDGGTIFFSTEDCVNLGPGVVRARMRAKITTNLSGATSGFSLLPFTGVGCTGTSLGSVDSNATGLTFNAWTLVASNDMTLPAGTASIRFKANADRNGGGNFSVLFDRIFVGSAVEIFSDGFDVPHVCRWDAP